MRKAQKLPYVFIGVLSIVVFASFGVGTMLINYFTTGKEQQLAQRLAFVAETKLEMIKELVDDQVATVLFLAGTPPIQGIQRAVNHGGLDPVEDTSTERWKERLQRIFVAYMGINPEIHQLRYIGVAEKGRELVRVNRNKQLLEVTENNLLQLKGDRDYFKDILELSPSQHYISRINLNQEYGQLEYPYQPTIRVAKPALDNNGQTFGFIIANVAVGAMLNKLKQPSGKIKAYLVDEEGNFLAHQDSQKEFQFELGSPLIWSDLYQPAKQYRDSSLLQVFKKHVGSSDELLGTEHFFELNPSAPKTVGLSLYIAESQVDWNQDIATLSRTVWVLVLAVASLFIIVIVLYQRHIRHQAALNTQLVEIRTIELQQETAKALKANDLINAFVANISHELRTPINGIMGMLSALEAKPLEPDASKKVNLAYRSAENLLGLVNNILDISKIEAGKVELDLQKTDLRKLLSFLLNTLVVLVKKDVRLLVDLSAVRHPMVYVDPTRLKQIITNLLSNSIKFTSHGEVR